MKQNLKHFREMTEEQILELQNKLTDVAVEYFEKNGFSGLSELGSHNLYHSIQDAIRNEYTRAHFVHKN